MTLNGLFRADVLRPLDLVAPSLTLPTNTTLLLPLLPTVQSYLAHRTLYFQVQKWFHISVGLYACQELHKGTTFDQ